MVLALHMSDIVVKLNIHLYYCGQDIKNIKLIEQYSSGVLIETSTEVSNLLLLVYEEFGTNDDKVSSIGRAVSLAL